MCIRDRKGAGIANAYRAYETQIDPDGKRGLDARRLWEKTKEALACVCAQTNGDIAAIAVASFGEAFVLLDEHDGVLHDIMIYTDRRGEKEFLREAEKTSQEEVACVCGLQMCIRDRSSIVPPPSSGRPRSPSAIIATISCRRCF